AGPAGRRRAVRAARRWTDRRGHSMTEKIPVAVLGATGAVGQKFITLLADHPWFEIAALAASERSAGKRYGDAVRWIDAIPLPPHIASMEILQCEPGIPGVV